MARFRQDFFKHKDPKWRMMEPCALIVLFVTLGMVLPLFFRCTPTQCVIMQGTTKPICPESMAEPVRWVGAWVDGWASQGGGGVGVGWEWDRGPPSPPAPRGDNRGGGGAWGWVVRVGWVWVG